MPHVGKVSRARLKHLDCEARLGSNFVFRFCALAQVISTVDWGIIIIIFVSLGRLSENLFAVNTEPFLAVIFVLALYC